MTAIYSIYISPLDCAVLTNEILVMSAAVHHNLRYWQRSDFTRMRITLLNKSKLAELKICSVPRGSLQNYLNLLLKSHQELEKRTSQSQQWRFKTVMIPFPLHLQQLIKTFAMERFCYHVYVVLSVSNPVKIYRKRRGDCAMSKVEQKPSAKDLIVRMKSQIISGAKIHWK